MPRSVHCIQSRVNSVGIHFEPPLEPRKYFAKKAPDLCKREYELHKNWGTVVHRGRVFELCFLTWPPLGEPRLALVFSVAAPLEIQGLYQPRYS